MADTRRPNVVFILTDDQGYADLACTGNPWIRTPHIDALHETSVRFTDYHVSPLCTPTRGALMSGRRPIRNGAWATAWGRSMLHVDETTLAELFRARGYRTGLFGKWHLGDNYPFRPMDRGFEHVVAHKGGGVGQTPDFWGNCYFDDTYFHNGSPVEHTGYCTDVWFDEAMRWIDHIGDEPFFCYLATNAPHGPYLVDEEYSAPYQALEDKGTIRSAAFYGMIANIDENLGRLRAHLVGRGLAENTIVMFMTDNGSSASAWLDDAEHPTGGYNAGMRGMKGSYYEGGHRVPFFLHWPEGGCDAGRDVGGMTLHVDLMPTLMDLCGLEHPSPDRLDGVSLAGLLDGTCDAPPDRTHFLQLRQGPEPPEKWTCAVMTPRWRLIGGRELYDVQADPAQRVDVSGEHPQVACELRQAHERNWAEVSPGLPEPCRMILGHDAENPSRLDAMDVMGDVAWNQPQVLAAKRSLGRWAVEIARPGRYRFSLRRWPAELDAPIDEQAPAGSITRMTELLETRMGWALRNVAIQPTAARLALFDRSETQRLTPGQREAVFEWDVPRSGPTDLEAWFDGADESGGPHGAYYVYVRRVR
jgi:arylsulfatase A-like enzyme